MTTLKERMEDAVRQALDIGTRELFPEIYEGFTEVEALAQGEDALLGIISNGIYEYFLNRNLQTITPNAAAEYEERLGIVPAETIEERREAISRKINSRFVIHDAKLHEICQAKAPGFTVYERIDPKNLTLGVFTEEEDEEGNLVASRIIEEIMPVIPQNLAVYTGVDTSIQRDVVVSHAHLSALWTSLGVVERKETGGMRAKVVINHAHRGTAKFSLGHVQRHE